MIRQANLADVDEILQVTAACAKAMISKNIHQWNEHYPSRAAFEEDIKRDELFVFTEEKHIIGTVVVSTLKDEVYDTITWLTPSDAHCVYIHRLAVHPDFQGQGIAQQLMQFAEEYARDNGFVSVRLDTFSKNDRNHIFYTKRGYEKLDPVYFPKQSKFPFYCYELVL